MIVEMVSTTQKPEWFPHTITNSYVMLVGPLILFYLDTTNNFD